MLGKERYRYYFLSYMSIIVRNNSNSLSVGSGGSGEGFPPGDINIIAYTTNDQSVQVKWSDPEDTIINGSTISTWSGTILIRNDNHYPMSIDDGILVIDNKERNKYKDDWYIDNNLINDHVYYYRFFTYNTEEVYNNSGNLIFNARPVAVPKVFAEASWDQIIKVCQTNTVPDTWNIGDEKI